MKQETCDFESWEVHCIGITLRFYQSELTLEEIIDKIDNCIVENRS